MKNICNPNWLLSKLNLNTKHYVYSTQFLDLNCYFCSRSSYSWHIHKDARQMVKWCIPSLHKDTNPWNCKIIQRAGHKSWTVKMYQALLFVVIVILSYYSHNNQCTKTLSNSYTWVKVVQAHWPTFSGLIWRNILGAQHVLHQKCSPSILSYK